MELLERAKISPLPVFYGLLYDYVAGVQSLDATRIGAMVDQPPAEAASSDRLFEEFVRPYESGETLGVVVDRMVRRLTTLEAAMVERQEATSAHSAELSAASLSFFEERLDRELMLEWVARLVAINDAAQDANTKLTAEAHKAHEDLAAAQNELRRLSRDSLVDPLTAIANRKGLDGVLSAALADARDKGKDLALAVVDIDRFKNFNDEYGHQVGDAILKLVSRAILATLRADDTVGRMGGDEFVAVMPGCGLAAAHERAEAIRRAVLNCDLAPILGNDILGCVTVSIGVATYHSGDTIVSLLDRADRQLLEAKSSGRNRVLSEPRPAEAKAS